MDKMWRISIWLMTALLLLSSIPIVLNENSGAENTTEGPTRAYSEDTIYGGEWYDDFSDDTWTENRLGLKRTVDGYGMDSQQEVTLFEEDYESYNNGQSVFGSNGWVADTARSLSSNKAQYTATTSGPTPMPSTKVGKIYNPDDDFSFILSKKIDIQEGILKCWFATDKIWTGATGSASAAISLFNSNTDTPDGSERVVRVVVRNAGIGYSLSPQTSTQMIITSGVTPNTWYRFEVRFNCSTDKADIYIFDGSGELLGSAMDTDFITSASSIKRIELLTSRDHSMVYTTSFWDDIKIHPPVDNTYITNSNFKEDYEGYSDGQNLFGQNGWMADTDRALSSDKAQYTATTSGPTPMPSDKVGKVYNPDDDFSYIYSRKIGFSSGIMECWIATDKVWTGTTGSASGTIGLYGTDSNDVDASDLVIRLVIRDEGIGYSLSTPTQTEMLVESGITADTWYRLEVMFNCTTETADIYIYNATGGLIGAALDTDFMRSASSLKRIELLTSRDHFMDYTTMYFDDIEITGLISDPNIYSKVITKPEGTNWSVLAVDKQEADSSWIELDIMNVSGMPITGFSYDPSNEDIDLAPLNGLDIDAIKLIAKFSGDKENSAILEGWGVEWTTPNAWRDSFLTELRSGSFTNTENGNGHIELSQGAASGEYETESITLPENCYWEILEINLTTNTGATLTLDIIDGSSGNTITGMAGITGDGVISWNISKIDPLVYGSLKVRGRFTHMSGNEPLLNSIALSWKMDINPPSIESFEIQPVVNRTQKAPITITLYDPDQSPGSLNIEVKHRVWGEITWGSDLISEPTFNYTTGNWMCDFAPLGSSPAGDYSFMVTVTDRVGLWSTMTFIKMINVVNNLPTMPIIELSPEEPTTLDNIYVVLVVPAKDIDGIELIYNYTFLINDEVVEECCLGSATESTEVSLPSSYTKKNDEVACRVFVMDDLISSASYTVSVVIENSPPEISEDIVDDIAFDEDTWYIWQTNLFDCLTDSYEDELTFESSGTKNITVSIDHETGWVNLTPALNYNGKDNISFLASDGIEYVSFNISVTVLPVNDLPTGRLLLPGPWTEALVGEDITFQAEASDVETPSEELNFYWKVAGETMGTDPLMTYNWTQEGLRNVSCFVSDGEEEIYLGSAWVNISLPDPIYTVEEVYRYYNNSGNPVLFELIDETGRSANHTEGVETSIDIKELKAEASGYEIVITMVLFSPPENYNNEDPFATTTGTWGMYDIYLVSSKWEEVEFNQTNLNIVSMAGYNPLVNVENMVGGDWVHLSYGHGSELGSPIVMGSSIVWTITMLDLAEGGFDISEYNLYGVSTYIKTAGGEMTGGFDSIGHGAREHNVVIPEIKEPEPEEEPKDKEGSLLWLFILIAVIMLIVVFAVVLIIVLRKGRSEEKDAEVVETTPDIAPEQITAPVQPEGLPAAPAEAQPITAEVPMQQPQQQAQTVEPANVDVQQGAQTAPPQITPQQPPEVLSEITPIQPPTEGPEAVIGGTLEPPVEQMANAQPPTPPQPPEAPDQISEQTQNPV